MTPPRRSLATGLLALRIADADVIALIRRCALDSIDQTRRGALAQLATGEALHPAELARRVDCHPHVATRALEDLALIGLVEEAGAAADGPRHGLRRAFKLAGPFVPEVQAAFAK
jgi:hypothetical protein